MRGSAPPGLHIVLVVDASADDSEPEQDCQSPQTKHHQDIGQNQLLNQNHMYYLLVMYILYHIKSYLSSIIFKNNLSFLFNFHIQILFQ